MKNGKSDIDQIHRNIKKIDWEAMGDTFDNMNVDSLDKVNAVLNKAHQRQGLPAETLDHYLDKELSIYIEAFVRRVDRWATEYNGWTAQTSKEEYTVTDSHEVPATTDGKGNVITPAHTEYTETTVELSFEMIQSGGWTTGNYSDGDLPAVKARTAKMAQRERGRRATIANGEAYIEKVLDGYEAAVGSGKDKDQFMKGMRDWMKRLDGEIAAQKEYATWTDQQILAQYKNDIVKNFRARNEWMLKRMQNLRRVFEILNELMRRGQAQLYPVYPDQDFSLWMEPLHHRRNVNYTIKSAGVAGVLLVSGVFMGYDMSPDFHTQVVHWAPQVADLLQKVSDLMHGYHYVPEPY